MWDWNQRKFEGLKGVTSLLTQSGIAEGFNEYCTLLEKGLRKQALTALNTFIQDTETWNNTRKREFVDWILWVELIMPEIHGLIPYTL